MAVVFWAYEKDDFGGKSISESANRHIRDVRDLGFPNDQLSSFRIAADTEVYLYEDKDFAGTAYHYYGPMERRKATDFPNDRISSFRVLPLGLSESEKVSCYTRDNAGLLDRCGSWARGSALNEGFMRDYCTGRSAASNGTCVTNACRQWCTANPGACDPVMISFCDSNPDHPYCSCIKSPASKIANPLCFDQKCITSGYATTNMRTTPCPSYIDCTVSANLINSGISLSQGLSVQQNCGNSGANSVPVTGNNTVTNTDTVAADSTNNWLDKIQEEVTLNPIPAIVIFLLLLVITVAAIALASGSSKKSLLDSARLDKIPQNRMG